MNIQNEVSKEIESIDWNEVKVILTTIVNLLQGLCDKLPNGNIKNILCGLISVIKIILAMLPS
jgi:hypothetical protein